jgi:transcriptional regulator
MSPVVSEEVGFSQAFMNECEQQSYVVRKTNMKINRRQMLAALAAGSSNLIGQKPTGIDPSLYIPAAHRVEDRNFLHDFMDEYSFVDLVSCTPTLRITHIPVILDRTVGAYGRILGHVSRQNPQHQIFDGQHIVVIVFRGPHGYISPTWYFKTDVVPTWNFAVVHATGRPSAITEKAALHDLLARLINKFESYQGSGYDFSKLPDSYVSSLMSGIAGFEMQIESLESKFKLGQERSEADKQRVLEHLRQAGRRERSLYDLSASFYQRSPEKHDGAN